MQLITISGLCKVEGRNSGYHNLELLVDPDNDDLADYFHDSDIFAKKIQSLKTGIEIVKGRLCVVSRAECLSPLSNEELVELVDYCQGQWSDGWGECYEQYDNKVCGVFVSPWFQEQQVQITFSTRE